MSDLEGIAVSIMTGEIVVPIGGVVRSRIKDGAVLLPDGTKAMFGDGLFDDFEAWAAKSIADWTAQQGGK
jgi:hypothetical protein